MLAFSLSDKFCCFGIFVFVFVNKNHTDVHVMFLHREMVFIEEAGVHRTAASAETPADGGCFEVRWLRLWRQVTVECRGNGLCSAAMWRWNGIRSLSFWICSNNCKFFWHFLAMFWLFFKLLKSSAVKTHLYEIYLYLPYNSYCILPDVHSIHGV